MSDQIKWTDDLYTVMDATEELRDCVAKTVLSQYQLPFLSVHTMSEANLARWVIIDLQKTSFRWKTPHFPWPITWNRPGTRAGLPWGNIRVEIRWDGTVEIYE